MTPSRSQAMYLNEDARITDPDGYVIFEDMSRRRREKFQASKFGYRTAIEPQPEFKPENDFFEVTFFLEVNDPAERLIVGRVTDQKVLGQEAHGTFGPSFQRWDAGPGEADFFSCHPSYKVLVPSLAGLSPGGHDSLIGAQQCEKLYAPVLLAALVAAILTQENGSRSPPC